MGICDLNGPEGPYSHMVLLRKVFVPDMRGHTNNMVDRNDETQLSIRQLLILILGNVMAVPLSLGITLTFMSVGWSSRQYPLTFQSCHPST